MHKFLLFFVLIYGNASVAQELNAQFIVNANLVNQTNQQIFETLERSVNEFINSQSWTEQEYLPEEKIQCSFIFNLRSYDSSRFEGTLQVQSLRTIYNSNYDSPVLNFMDRDISFTYLEFQPLFYAPASYQSNLVSILSFYAFFILGINADTLNLKGGDLYFDQAQRIVNLSQQGGAIGWKQNDGNRNRFWLIDTIRSNTFREYRAVQYQYHREGMDIMTTDLTKAKNGVLFSLEKFLPLYKRRPNAFLIQTFFDAKSDEIVDIFSEGPKVEVKKALRTLNKIAPYFGPKWEKIR